MLRHLVRWGSAALLMVGCAEANPVGPDAGGFEQPEEDSGRVHITPGDEVPEDYLSDDESVIDPPPDPPAVDAGADDLVEPFDDVASVLSEANIVHVQNDRLFALSAIGELTVIDASDPSALRELGHYTFEGVPDEMYVRGDVVIVIARNLEVIETSTTVTSVLALDVGDPAAIDVRSKVELPGWLVDSRASTEWLYVALADQEEPGVHTVAVGDPDALARVDSAVFAQAGHVNTAYFSATRAYVASSENPNGHIRVVDIDDATGALEASAVIATENPIQNRWQMDEHEGVLRVITQVAWDFEPPVLETFRIEADGTAPRLARLELVIPPEETLRSVRFDGPRAYAITANVWQDPLFTLDLSDPTAPVQTADLELPGWVRHMEPRGDRLIGFGYEAINPTEGMNVSLFDVTDLENPSLLARVAFEGDNFDEADELHQSFRVLDDEGLILVPFAHPGWLGSGCGRDSGVQLVDFTRDTLTLRGAAGASSTTKRALVHRDHLITVASHAVEAFDIGDRDAPELKSAVHMRRDVQELAVAGENLLRLVDQDADHQGGRLDVVPLAEPNARAVLSEIELDALGDEVLECRNATLNTKLLASERYAVLVRTSESLDNEDVRASLTVVDLQGPAHAEVVHHAELDGLQAHQRIDSIVLVGDALVLVGRRQVIEEEDERITGITLYVVDLSEPSAPVMHAVDLGDADGRSKLAIAGHSVFLTLTKKLAARRVRHTLVELDVQDPAQPVVAQRTTVLGKLLAMLDEETALTRSYELHEEPSIRNECHDYDRNYLFTPDERGNDDFDAPGTCEWFESALHVMTLGGDAALLAGTLPIYKARVESLATDDGRAVIALGRYEGERGTGDFALAVPPSGAQEVLRAVSAPQIENDVSHVFLRGETALAMTYTKVFAIDLSSPADATTQEVDSIGLWRLASATQHEDAVLAARHDEGVTIYAIDE